MLEDLLEHLLLFDESDDSHLALAFRAGKGINLIIIFDKPKRVSL
jgi:hypothetical protein